MKKILATTFGLAALLAVNPAFAATTFDTSLASPPGVYFGSGNSGLNSHFTVFTGGSPTGGPQIEIGLSAIERFVGNITPTGSVYNVSTGPTGVVGKTGADWGVDFSINTKGTLLLSQLTSVFKLTDVGLGTTGSFDALAIPDNAKYDGVTTCAIGPCALPNAYSAQNSEPLSFAAIAAAFGDPAFNLNANNTYIFSLEVFGPQGVSLGLSEITVVAGSGATGVPEPLTLSLFGAGLVGAVAARRRKRKA